MLEVLWLGCEVDVASEKHHLHCVGIGLVESLLAALEGAMFLDGPKVLTEEVVSKDAIAKALPPWSRKHSSLLAERSPLALECEQPKYLICDEDTSEANCRCREVREAREVHGESVSSTTDSSWSERSEAGEAIRS